MSGVEDWASGRRHDPPAVFGDSAQRMTAQMRRLQKWQRLQRENPAAAIQWPEFGNLLDRQRQFLMALAQKFRPRFRTLLAEIPDFWEFCRDRPLLPTGIGDRETKRAYRRRIGRHGRTYQIQMILWFMGEFGSSRMYVMMASQNCPRAWWDIDTVDIPRMAEAA